MSQIYKLKLCFKRNSNPGSSAYCRTVGKRCVLSGLGFPICTMCEAQWTLQFFIRQGRRCHTAFAVPRKTVWCQVAGAAPGQVNSSLGARDAASSCGPSVTSGGPAGLEYVPCWVGFLPALVTFPGDSGQSCQLPLPLICWEEKLRGGIPSALGLSPRSPVNSPRPPAELSLRVPHVPLLRTCRTGPQSAPRGLLSLQALCPVPPRAAGLPVLPTAEPAVLQHQLVGRPGGARGGGGGAQGQRQGEGQ